MAKRNKKASVVIEPPLPGASDLPVFEGVQPVGVVTKINGSSQRIGRAIHLGEKGVALVEWTGENIAHKRGKDGTKRHQTLDVLDLYEVSSDRANEWLAEVRAEHRKKNPQMSLEDLEGPGGAVKVDGSGVVMTDKEAAEALASDLEAVAELEAGRAKKPDDAAPWDGYDEMGVAAIKTRLDETTDRSLVLAAGMWEDAHKKRSGVVDAVTRRGAQLLAQGTA